VRRDWPEHPDGDIVLITNDQGLRENAPVEAQKQGRRILVAGDSHTGGLVMNEATCPNLLERNLSALPGWEGVDVVNAGVPFTGPICYHGILRKYLYLKPDVFIAVLFTGNDFADDLRLQYILDGWSLPQIGGEYRDRVRAATKQHPGGLYQGFNQAIRWKYFPSEMDHALEIVIASYKAIQELCDEKGIEFLAVVLPTKMDVDDDDLETQRSTREQLGLSPEDVAVNRRLGAHFAAAMKAAGIACLDPIETMKAHQRPLYWTKDYHLGAEGHVLLAEQILRKLQTPH
jgi:lysophospholipase L1-like esterase